MRILITRPEREARALAERVKRLGHEPVVESLLEIHPLRSLPNGDFAGVQALLFTSTNGVKAFASAYAERRFPVYAVGDSTAEAARAAGFAEAHSAAGDVRDLAALVIARLKPSRGALLHARGAAAARDLAAALQAEGFEVKSLVLYEAQPVRSLSPGLAHEIAARRIDVACFFSPRTAEAFVRLMDGAGLSAQASGITALALSEAVAQRLAVLCWRRILVAERADLESLIRRIGEAAG